MITTKTSGDISLVEVKREPMPKSKLIIGNFTIYFDKNFNWFNRLMIRLVFGLNIQKIKGSDKE